MVEMMNKLKISETQFMDDIHNKSISQLKDYIRYLKEKLQLAKNFNKEEAERISNELNATEKRLDSEQLETSAEMVYGLTHLAGILDSSIRDNIGQLTNAINDLIIGFKGLASNDTSTAFSGFMSFILGWADAWNNQIIASNSMMQDMQALIGSYSAALQHQFDAINRSLGTEKILEYEEALRKVHAAGDSLIKQRISGTKGKNLTHYGKMLGMEFEELDIEELEKYIEYYSQIQGLLSKSENANNAVILQVLNEIRDLKIEEGQIKADLYQLLTGTTSQAISDSISEGFANGLNSVEDFADKTSSIIRNALMQSFQAEFLDKQLQGWYEGFAEDIKSDGGLDPDEALRNKELLNEIITDSADAFESYRQMMEEIGIWNTSEVEQRGLAGAIKGITEDTAGVLAGQIGAIRFNVLEQLEISKQGLMYQKETALNTRRLENIESHLATLVVNNGLTERINGR